MLAFIFLGGQKPAQPNVTGQSTLDIKAGIEAWKGQYITTITKQAAKCPVLLVDVTSTPYVVRLDKDTVQKSKYSNGTLTWSSEDDNKTSGEVKFIIGADDSGQAMKTFSAYLWDKGAAKPGSPNFSGKLDVKYMKPWSGSYMTIQMNSKNKWESGLEVVIEGGSSIDTSHVSMGGKEMKTTEYSSPSISWTSEDTTKYDVAFYVDPHTKKNHFSGYIWKDSKPTKANFVGSLDNTGLAPWSAYYKTDTEEGGKWTSGPEVIIEGACPGSKTPSVVTIDGKTIKGLQFNNPVLTWKDSTNEYNASLRFYIKDGSRTRRFAGKLWKPSDDIPDPR